MFIAVERDKKYYVVDEYALSWFIRNFGWWYVMDGDLHQAAIS